MPPEEERRTAPDWAQTTAMHGKQAVLIAAILPSKAQSAMPSGGGMSQEQVQYSHSLAFEREVWAGTSNTCPSLQDWSSIIRVQMGQQVLKEQVTHMQSLELKVFPKVLTVTFTPAPSTHPARPERLRSGLRVSDALGWPATRLKPPCASSSHPHASPRFQRQPCRTPSASPDPHCASATAESKSSRCEPAEKSHSRPVCTFTRASPRGARGKQGQVCAEDSGAFCPPTSSPALAQTQLPESGLASPKVLPPMAVPLPGAGSKQDKVQAIDFYPDLWSQRQQYSLHRSHHTLHPVTHSHISNTINQAYLQLADSVRQEQQTAAMALKTQTKQEPQVRGAHQDTWRSASRAKNLFRCRC